MLRRKHEIKTVPIGNKNTSKINKIKHVEKSKTWIRKTIVENERRDQKLTILGIIFPHLYLLCSPYFG